MPTDEERLAFKRAEHERIQGRYDWVVEQYVECEAALRAVYNAKAFSMLPRAVQDRVRAVMGETTQR